MAVTTIGFTDFPAMLRGLRSPSTPDRTWRNQFSPSGGMNPRNVKIDITIILIIYRCGLHHNINLWMLDWSSCSVWKNWNIPQWRIHKPPVVQVTGTEKTMLHMVIRSYAWLSSHLLLLIGSRTRTLEATICKRWGRPVVSWFVNPIIQWIGLRENLQESPIFNGKIYGFL
jgi:hypothetical protein